MAAWKKVLLWIAGILVVTVGGSVMALDHLFSGMCATTVFDEIPSPSKKLKAVVFQIDCGAATDFNTQVVIVKASLDTSDEKSLPKGFFVADKDHERAPAGITHGPEVRLTWESDEALNLQHHQFARIFRSESEQKGVTIKYQTFQ
jgi:hypothetical protein